MDSTGGEAAPLDCAAVRARLPDYLAGRLAAAEFDAVQRHVVDCALCRRAIATLSERPAEHPAGRRSGLNRRLAHRSDAYRRRKPSWVWLLALAALAGYLFLRGPSEIERTVAERLASAPVHDLKNFADAARPPEFASAEPGAARSWLAGRVAFDLPTPPAKAGAARLVGARLARFLDRDVPAFVYESDAKPVALYLLEAAKLPPLGAEDGTLLVRGPGSEGGLPGFAEVLWRQGPLVYVLAAAMPEDDLVALARRFAAEQP